MCGKLQRLRRGATEGKKNIPELVIPYRLPRPIMVPALMTSRRLLTTYTKTTVTAVRRENFSPLGFP